MADAALPSLDAVLAELGAALKAQAASTAAPQAPVAGEDLSSLPLAGALSPKDRLAIEQAAPGSPVMAGVELQALDARFAAQAAQQSAAQIKAAFAAVLPALMPAAQAALAKAGG